MDPVCDCKKCDYILSHAHKLSLCKFTILLRFQKKLNEMYPPNDTIWKKLMKNFQFISKYTNIIFLFSIFQSFSAIFLPFNCTQFPYIIVPTCHSFQVCYVYNIKYSNFDTRYVFALSFQFEINKLHSIKDKSSQAKSSYMHNSWLAVWRACMCSSVTYVSCNVNKTLI